MNQINITTLQKLLTQIQLIVIVTEWHRKKTAKNATKIKVFNMVDFDNVNGRYFELETSPGFGQAMQCRPMKYCDVTSTFHVSGNCAARRADSHCARMSRVPVKSRHRR